MKADVEPPTRSSRVLDTRKAAPFLALGLFAFALAGCVDGGNRSFTVPDTADPVARQPDVQDPHRVEVAVTQESDEGRPLPGVGVVFFRESGTGDDASASGSASAETRADGSTAETHVEIDVSDVNGTGYEALASGRTPSNGTVTGFLAPNTTVHVLVGGATGFTQEARFRVPVGAAGGTTELTVPLFHDRLNFAGNGTIPTSVSTRDATMEQTEPERFPVEVPLAEPDSVEQAYLERLARVEIALSWTNDPPTHADLYVGWGAGGTMLVAGEDTRQEPGSGQVTERLTVEPDTVSEHRETLLSAGQMTVFAVTDNVAASPPDGVPFVINGTSTYEGTGHAFTIRG